MEPVRRIQLGLVGFVLVVVAGVGGYWVGADRQTEIVTEVIQSVPITAVVERRDLESVHLANGVVRFRSVMDIGSRSAPDYWDSVITWLEEDGAVVEAGSVVAEVSGRPVVVLPGVFRLYRTIRSGDVGPDVAQLQAALVETGFSVSDDPGVFGISTQRAVEALYEAAGYEPWEESRRVVVRPDEIVFVAALPAQFVRSGAVLGADTNSDGLGKIVGGEAVLSLELSPEVVEFVSVGTEARVTIESGEEVSGEVSGIDGSVVTVSVDLPVETEGSSAMVRIVLKSNADVLVVPVTAVSTDGAGSSRVSRVMESGSAVDVPVVLGFVSKDGWAEIEGDLDVGDEVIVGWVGPQET